MPNAERQQPPASGTQAVDRAALLVSTVVRADEPLTFAELQEACGLAKSTTSRMLTALERPACSSATPPGPTSPAGSSGCTPPGTTRGRSWSGWPGPTMEQIGEDTGETVHLSVTRGERVVQVAQVDSRYLLGTARLDRGRRAARTAPRSARCFYAYGALPLPDRRRSSARPPHTHADLDALRRDGAESGAGLGPHRRRARGRAHRRRRPRPRRCTAR